ncbi:BamA/TamA family outer membrane protein [Niabella yanshanensis]|uniref:BamA/TamA family outer membrane protein n=1 Tax=Niabella yanshanensis TaxID=577386 RepID=A0ABZ0WCQ0_9BACT|nr:BamA/TamA family outer membrane protein [Niabella yanshanensis]WQD40557.1 BamA/TamA family outer membrane protein [Niabella yanshanensis]
MVFVFSSCTLFTVVRNEPQNKPYIFQTAINIKDNDLKKDEKSRLEAGLYEQLDDSIAARKLDKVFWEVLKNPQPLDTGLISRSLEFMNNYMVAEGYFHDSINFTTQVKNSGDQQRAFIDFNVWPGKPTRIDSLGYDLQDDSLQFLTNKNLKDALIKKGDRFAQTPISLEMDRLVELYRNNGYLLFTRNNLYALWDTLDLELLQPALDPLEQVTQIQKYQERKENPTANLEIRQKQLTDSISLQKYYVGNVTVYPDVRADTSNRSEKISTIRNVTVVQRSDKFKPKIFPQYVYLTRGELYRQSRYMRTVNRFNNLGTWRLVDIQQIPRERTDTVDFVMRLTPAPKYNFTTNLEGSFSQSVISGNFVGLGLNVGLQNRNFLKGANQLNTNIREGVELGGLNSGQFIQTRQISLSNSLIFPRYVFPGMNNFRQSFRGNIQSVLSLNAANTERRLLFNLTSFNTSWGYEFGWRSREYALTNRTFNLGIKIPNIEYSYIKKRDSLLSLISENPSIQNLFSDGLITSVITNFSMPWNSANRRSINVLRMNLEASGLLTGMVRNSFIDEQLYRFVKLDAEYAKLIKLSQKTGLVVRGFAGIGYELDATANPLKRSQLPFFKQYYSGGPNSMRAWQLRRLGPGSTVKYYENDASIDGEFIVPDRFGDVQLEANIEYRLPLFNIAGLPINGALFTDIGNIWYLKKEAGSAEERFRLSRLGKDIAIGSGAGIRADFSFFVIRLDYAYKVKDPSPDGRFADYQNKFFAYPFFRGSQLQIGIGYPFIF